MNLQSTTPDQNINRAIEDLVDETIKTLGEFMKLNPGHLESEGFESFVRYVFGTIRINGFQLDGTSSHLMGLYPNCSTFEHSCVANTKREFDSDHNLIVKASMDISKGEHVSTMYTKMLWGTAARQKSLLENKFFICHCRRCIDPTELGTYFSALKCYLCPKHGYYLPENALVADSLWRCNKCSKYLSPEEAKSISDEVEECMELSRATPRRRTIETVIDNLAATKVHPNHFHLFLAKFMLLQMYGRDEDGSVSNKSTISKKEAMCSDFLDLCLTIDPGSASLSKYIGITLFEYQDAVMSRVSTGGELDTQGYLLAKDILQRCVKFLSNEKDNKTCSTLKSIAEKKLQKH